MGLQTTLAAVALAAAASLAGNAQAAYAIYFGEDLNDSPVVPLAQTPQADQARASFLSKLTKVGTETFETQAVGTSAPLTLQFPGAGDGKVTATLSGGNGVVNSVPEGQTDGNGRYSVPSASTSQYWEVAAGTDGASTFNVTFGQAIAAFGFYGIDIGDFGGQLELLLFDGDEQIDSLLVPNTQGDGGSTDGSVLYFGVIAQDKESLFTSVRFQMTTVDIDVFAFDNFTVAELAQVAPPGAVPEPGTLALMVAALLALGLSRRSRT